MPSPILRRILFVLLGVAALAFVFDLGGSSIWDANEAFYAETPREMIERGDYVTPTFNYEPRINKPALSYWMVAGLYRVFGVEVGVERAAIAAMALVMIAAAFFLGRAASSSPYAPAIAAIGLAANPRFFMFGRRILVDVLVAACMTLTLLLFAQAERHPDRRRLFLILMYVSVGLGMLAKGPVAAALPALAFFGYLAYYRDLPRIGQMMIPAGLVIVLAMVAPWYIALYQQSGWEPIRAFFVGENLERFTTSLGTGGRGPFFYLPVVFTDGLPWSLLLPVAAFAWFRERRDRKATSNDEHRIRALLLIWVVVIVGFFSLSSTKQDLYILPIISAVAALGADILSRGAIEAAGKWRAAVSGTLLVTGLVLAAAGALALYVFDQAGAAYELDGTMLLGVIGILGGVVAVAFAGRRAVAWAAIALAGALVAVNWTLALRVLPAFERYKPSVPLSRKILEHAEPGDRVIHYEVAMPSMVFYLARRVEAAFSRDEFLAAAKTGAPTYGVMPEDRYLDLRADLGPAYCVLDRQPTFDAKLREMLARRPPQAIVLISTRCPK